MISSDDRERINALEHAKGFGALVAAQAYDVNEAYLSVHGVLARAMANFALPAERPIDNTLARGSALIKESSDGKKATADAGN